MVRPSVYYRQLLSRKNQLLNSGSHSLLMFANLLFIKKILRNKNQIRRVFIIPVFITAHPKYLRMIQTHLKKYIIKFFVTYNPFRYISLIAACACSDSFFSIICARSLKIASISSTRSSILGFVYRYK